MLNFQLIPFLSKALLICSASFLMPASHLLALPDTIPDDILHAIDEHIKENSWPSLYYDVLPRVINKYGYKSVVEIGVALGGHAEAILSNTAVEHYYGVDPYVFNYDVKDQFNTDVGNYSARWGGMNFFYLYKWVKNVRLAPFGDRASIIREYSTTASGRFEEESIDCIFIDGNHNYPDVVKDLQAWYPKLRKRGIILGDDYWMEPVANAVNDYFQSEGKQVFFVISKSGYRIWAVYK